MQLSSNDTTEAIVNQTFVLFAKEIFNCALVKCTQEKRLSVHGVNDCTLDGPKQVAITAYAIVNGIAVTQVFIVTNLDIPWADTRKISPSAISKNGGLINVTVYSRLSRSSFDFVDQVKIGSGDFVNASIVC